MKWGLLSYVVKIKKQEHIQPFIEKFLTLLADELYDELDFDESFFEELEEGEWTAYLEEEPMFNYCGYGEQLEPVFEEFLKQYPDAEISADYECTFSNCGDMVWKHFRYENGTLTIIDKHTEMPYLTGCPKCGHDKDMEDWASFEDWFEDAPCVCPKCGAEINFEASQDITCIEIVSAD